MRKITPDLAPQRFSPLLRPQKDSLRGYHFKIYGVVEEAMHNLLAQQPNDFYSRGIYAGTLEEVRRT